jgi:hypothetical protein
MKLSFLLISDYATTTADNKLVIGGEFDSLTALSFPVVHPTLTVIGRIEAELSEGESHELSVRVLAPDGRELRRLLVTRFPLQPAVRPGVLRAQFLIRADALELPMKGVYKFQVVVDGRQLGDAVLTAQICAEGAQKRFQYQPPGAMRTN